MKYQRMRQTNRQKEDFEMKALAHLNDVGPAPITKFVYVLQTSHQIVNRTLISLMERGFVMEAEPELLGIKYYSGGGHRRYRHVRFLFAITTEGEKYLKKQNKLQNLLRWKDSKIETR